MQILWKGTVSAQLQKQSPRGMKACIFIKKRLQHWHLPVNFAKVLMTSFLQEWLLLQLRVSNLGFAIFLKRSCFSEVFFTIYRCFCDISLTELIWITTRHVKIALKINHVTWRRQIVQLIYLEQWQECCQNSNRLWCSVFNNTTFCFKWLTVFFVGAKKKNT